MNDLNNTYREVLTRGNYQFAFQAPQTGPSYLLSVTFPDLVEYSERKFMTSAPATTSHILLPVDKKLKGIAISSNRRELRFLDAEKKVADKSLDKIVCEEWVNGFEIDRAEIPGMKDVYVNHNVLGNPKFDSDGNLYMICEAADPSHIRGYFTADSGKDPMINPKFRMVTDFGETMLKTRDTRIIMRLASTREFREIILNDRSRLPLFVCPLVNARTSILVTVLVRRNDLYTPGISRCFNRQSTIFCRNDSGEMVPITDGLFMALAPTVSPDGKILAFIGSESRFDTHCSELDLFLVEISDGPRFSKPNRMNIPKVRNDTSKKPTFNGIYLSAQSESELMAFLADSTTLVVPSFSCGRSGIFLVNTRTQECVESVFPPCHEGKLSSVVLLRVCGNEIIFIHSGYLCQRSVWVAKVMSESEIQYTELLTSPRLDEKICAGFHGGKISVIPGLHSPAWLLESGCVKTGPRPLIAYLHGGPFMGAISGFSVEMAAFLSQGYDVVIPNYRGSFSYGREFLHELEGFVGIKDVDDCQDSVVRAKDIVKPSLIIAYGGSHGGFLTGWLLGHPEYRSTYAGGVLWNPAVDLVSSNLTSDIPDWAINVAIGPVDDPVEKFAPSIHFLKRAYAQSAISVVRNVKAPALVLLGSNDRRVVPCAGLRWAQAVQEMGGDVEVHWYPDQGHAIPGPEYYETAIVTVGMWIKQKFT